jgi:hypothetical protein
MSENVIYFPYMRVPYSQWFTRVLLYWDKVYSIVPESQLDELGTRMDELISNELISPLYPDRYINNLPHFESGFIDYLNRQDISASGERTKLNWFDLHTDKFSPNLLDELERRGLARIERRVPWVEVESQVASHYMIYLAGCLGAHREIRSTPITDNKVDFGALDPGYNINRELEDMRGTILMDILPVPEKPVNPGEIAAFKDDHRRELSEFRQEIECFLPTLVAIRDTHNRNLMKDQFVDRMVGRINDLSEGMKDRHWTNINKERLIIYAPALAELAAGILVGAVNPVAGALAFIGAAYRDRNYLRGDDLLRNNNCAYAFLSRQRWSN